MSISGKTAQVIDLVRPLRVNSTPPCLKYPKKLPYPTLPAPTDYRLQHPTERFNMEIARERDLSGRVTVKNAIASSVLRISCHAPAVSYMSLYQPVAR